MSKHVYLAGPITGRSYLDATDWRKVATRELAEHGITGLSPLRGKEYLAGLEHLPHTADQPLSTQKGITTRDRWDCTRSDLVLVNFEDTDKRLDTNGQERASIGTCMEIAWADAHRVPVVMVMRDGNVHDHPMIREAVGFIVPTLEEALALVVGILA